MADTFFIPVRESKAGTLALQTGRLRTGERVGLAFTTEASLLQTMGSSPQWVRMGGQALKDMLAPLRVEQVRIDPCAACDRHPQRLAPVRIRPRPRHADLGRHAA